jgi:DNA-binding GntR family transcriptional regulator
VGVGQRGFHVAPASAADLDDITNTRVLIECEALRRAIEIGDHGWEIELMSTLHKLEKIDAQLTGARSASPIWRQAHGRFHFVLVSACASPTLLAIRGALFDRAERYRNLSEAHRPPGRDKVGEHRALMLAAIGRDTNLALTLIEKHIRRTAENVLQYAGHVLRER